jgi:hypothetical protein
MPIVLGSEVRDSITGFTGRVVSRIEYITGCIQYGVAPPVKADGALPSTEYFDAQRLAIIGDPIAQASRPTGGPQRDAPKS